MNMHTVASPTGLLGSFSDDELTRLVKGGAKKHWKKGETIFLRGDPGDYIVVIDSGIAEVSITALNGRKSVLNHVKPGEMLGEIALLDGGTRSADVMAHSDLTGTLIHRRDVRKFLSENPNAVFGLIDQLCENVRNASEMFETQAMTSASARLARCLLRIAEKWGEDDKDGPIPISQRFSQTDLGELSGLARENVNRYIRRWSLDGIMSFDRGRIEILDLLHLRSLADQADG